MLRTTNGTQTTVWPSTSVSGETGRPTRLKNISADRPKASAGSTSGDMNALSSSRAESRRDRATASAAATPSSTESAVDQVATMRLFRVAKWSCQASSSSTYQRSE